MAIINTYLNLNGKCEESFNFYKPIMGGEFDYLRRLREMPESEYHKVSETVKNKIMHVGIPIGSSILMGSDRGGEWGHSFIQRNNFSNFITANSKQDSNKLFNDLSIWGNNNNANGQYFLGRLYWHVHRSIWHTLDGKVLKNNCKIE